MGWGLGQMDEVGVEWCGVMISWDWVIVMLSLGLGLGGSGLRRLCVVCATTKTCCKCNDFIQNHAPG